MITEIINGIRVQCGPDFPIGVRLSVEEFLDKTGVTEDYIHIQDGVKIAMALENCGIDFIDVSVGLYETGSVCVEPISFPQGWRKDLIKAVKDHVSIPVIGVSCIREPQVAESFLEGGLLILSPWEEAGSQTNSGDSRYLKEERMKFVNVSIVCAA